MLRPILLTTTLLMFAIAVMANGLDRMSKAAPAIERLVPGPFRAQSARSAAIIALSREEQPLAQQHARTAVSADPVDPDAAALLAATRLLGTDAAGADAAMRVAARFGWRNLATQMYWYRAALQVGDFEVATDRADAILRIYPAYPGRDDLLAPLETNPEARKILIRHLAEKPDWLDFYFSGNQGNSDETMYRRAVVGEEIGSIPAWSGCDRIFNLTRQLLSRGYRSVAEGVWNANCPDSRVPSGLVDADFRYLERGVRNPFGWIVSRSGSISLRLEASGDATAQDQVVVLRNDGTVTARVLQQAVDLKPGKYRLRASLMVDGRPVNGQPVNGWMIASIGCGASAPFPRKIEGDLDEGGQILTIGACEMQKLALWLRPGREYVRLDSVELTAAD